MKFNVKFALAALLQVFCLMGMIGYKYASLAAGTEIALEVPRPKDPRSLFRGDYVIIRYAINDLDLRLIDNDIFQCRAGDDIYVKLAREGDVWKPVWVSDSRPEGDVLFIRGKADGDCDENRAWVKYGIEQYFVPEDTGPNMERRLREVRKAVVSVDPDGRATVVRIPEPEDGE